MGISLNNDCECIRNDEIKCFFSNFYSHLNTLLLQKHHTVVNVHYPSSHPHKAIDNAGDNTVDNSKKNKIENLWHYHSICMLCMHLTAPGKT